MLFNNLVIIDVIIFVEKWRKLRNIDIIFNKSCKFINIDFN